MLNNQNRSFPLSLHQIYTAWHFSWTEMLARYRQTILGPIWIVMGTGIGVVGLVLVWSQLMPSNNDQFIISVGYGLILWQLISMTLLEASSTLVQNASTLTSIKIPPIFFTIRVIFKGLINFLHALLLLPALFYFNSGPILFDIFPFLLGTTLFLINLTWMVYLISILGARFRDTEPILSAILPLLFFISPILFHKNAFASSTKAQFLINFNPLSNMINIARSPLIGQDILYEQYLYSCLMALIGYTIVYIVHQNHKNNIPFWV